MPNFTEKYNLKKPLGTENYNVADQNSNMDIIDEELGKQAKQINDCLVPATKDNLGMIKIGDNLTITKEGKLNGVAPYTHPNDANTRHVTDAQINTWNNKAPAHDHPYIPTSASCNKNWNWDGQGGQPTWLWGGNDPSNMFVYNPANFNVNYANSAGNANALGGLTLNQVLAKGGDIVGKTIRFEKITTNLSNPSTNYVIKNFSYPKGGMLRVSTSRGDTEPAKIKITVDGTLIYEGEMREFFCVSVPQNSGGFGTVPRDIPFKSSVIMECTSSQYPGKYFDIHIFYYLNE